MTTLIKLGGSLVTDKAKPKSFRRTTVQHIARQLYELQMRQPDRRLVLGHGSGSFGHFEARKYHTMRGVYSAEDRMGFARVGAAASELSQLILGELLAAGISALRFQPSAMQVARDKVLVHFDTRSIKLALEMRFLPLVYGDVSLDETLGGTIIATESIFAALVQPLEIKNILLLGNVDGVLDKDGQVIPIITTDTVAQFEQVLGPSDGVDVTGGMRQKVWEMLQLAQRNRDLDIFIANGNRKDILKELLVMGGAVGTRISAG
ncbi:MAG: isopentenyl phosphate kinase [Chloroflexi bacterium]|nr:isopentenyl phosphate kinase [Chloroflexota bacterium]